MLRKLEYAEARFFGVAVRSLVGVVDCGYAMRVEGQFCGYVSETFLALVYRTLVPRMTLLAFARWRCRRVQKGLTSVVW